MNTKMFLMYSYIEVTVNSNILGNFQVTSYNVDAYMRRMIFATICISSERPLLIQTKQKVLIYRLHLPLIVCWHLLRLVGSAYILTMHVTIDN